MTTESPLPIVNYNKGNKNVNETRRRSNQYNINLPTMNDIVNFIAYVTNMQYWSSNKQMVVVMVTLIIT